MAIGNPNTSVPTDGNYRRMSNALVSPGTGLVVPQGDPNILTDSITGQQYAPSMVSLSPYNSGLQVNLPAIVQKATNTSTGSVTTLATAFASNNVAGNSIVVVAGVGNGTAMTCADSAGNTYYSAAAAPNSTTFATQIFYAVNIAKGANTVTVTNGTTGASMDACIYEVSGLIAQLPSVLGQTAISTGTGTTASTAAVAGPANSLAFLGVAVGTTAEAITAVTGTPWTVDASLNSGATVAGLYSLGSAHLALGNIVPVVPQATIAASKAWSAAVAIFKPVLLAIEGSVNIRGYQYTPITTQTTTLVKTGPGVLHAIVINKPLASGVIKIDDALTDTTPVIGTITLPGTLLQDGPKVATYDLEFTVGLTIVTSGATQDITVVWR